MQAQYPTAEQQWLSLQWKQLHSEARLRGEESRMTDRSDGTAPGTGGAPSSHAPTPEPSGASAVATPSPGGAPGGAAEGERGYFGAGAGRAAAVWRAGVAAVKARVMTADSANSAAVRPHRQSCFHQRAYSTQFLMLCLGIGRCVVTRR